MLSEPFKSFAQNGEDVVLWRALGAVTAGRYVDVGANHPTRDSVTKAFYDHGWRGILVEPVPEFAALLRDQRPDDQIIEAAITSGEPGQVVLHEVPGTGLSTLVTEYRDRHVASGRSSRDLTVATRSLDEILTEAGWQGQDIHFMSVDTEGAERTVLESIDLRRWRPWVLVIESTAPNTFTPTHQAWEELVTGAGYRFVFFDGLSRYYVVDERWDELSAPLSFQATTLDNYTTRTQRESEQQLEQLHAQIATQLKQLDTTGQQLADLRGEHHELSQLHHELSGRFAALQASLELSESRADRLAAELAALRESTSWRLTRPARALKQAISRRGD